MDCGISGATAQCCQSLTNSGIKSSFVVEVNCGAISSDATLRERQRYSPVCLEIVHQSQKVLELQDYMKPLSVHYENILTKVMLEQSAEAALKLI
jgi:hypothetical protein